MAPEPTLKMKALLMIPLFAAITLIVAGPASDTTSAELDTINQATVQVSCNGGAGSAVNIGKYYVSVKHVTNMTGCKINGLPIKVHFTAATYDFSIIENPNGGPHLDVDCVGYVPARRYLAVGHARGLEENTALELTGTGIVNLAKSMAALAGVVTVIPGQSGGAIVDETTSKLVGVINSYEYEEGYSGSVPLALTPICKAR